MTEEIKNRDAYIRFIRDELEKTKGGELRYLYTDPTPGKIKKECINLWDALSESGAKDISTLINYFEFPEETEKKECRIIIKSCDADDFKPISNFLKGDTDTIRNDDHLNLLALIFNIQPRPLRNFLVANGGQESIAAIEEKTTTKSKLVKYIEDYSDITKRILAQFVGRQFVFDKIDNFISSHDRGYFFIKGNPGIGKTALTAKLVQDKGYYYHIINAQNNGENTEKEFIQNVCSQLIINKKLPIEELPTDIDRNGNFLLRILKEVSGNQQTNEKVVVVVDGLDELKDLTLFKNANILYLPHYLPPNIYFILTMRDIEDQIGLPKEDNKDIFKIEHDSDLNRADINTYVYEHINDEKIQEYIKQQGVEESEFIKVIEDKVDGNFIYLKYLFFDIGKGGFSDVKLDEIPKGLEAYYQRHWQKIKIENNEHWKEALQVIAALTHTYSPISVDLICDAFSIEDRFLVISIIKKMEQFLHKKVWEDIEGYKFYHKSLLDFLNKKEEVKVMRRSTLLGFSDLSKDFFD